MFHEKPHIWGITTMGERGQVVIPASVREEMHLEKGDKIIVVSKGQKFIGLVKESEMTGLLKNWLKKIEKLKQE